MRENYYPSPGNFISRREPDTYHMQRMRAQLKTSPAKPTPNATWAALPMGQRVHLCMVALGPSGVGAIEKQWLDLEPRERMLIGAAARAEAAALL